MEALSPGIGCQTLLQLLILAVWLLQIIINSPYARYSRQRLSLPNSNSSHPFKLIRAVDSSYDPGNSSMPLKFPMEARSEVIQNHSNSPKRPTSNWTPPTTITPSSTVLIIWKRWRMRRRIYGLLTRPCSLNSVGKIRDHHCWIAIYFAHPIWHTSSIHQNKLGRNFALPYSFLSS